MKDIQNKIKAYTELQKVLQKYSDEFKGDFDVSKIKSTLQRLEISERFGIPLSYGFGDVSYSVEGVYDNWTRVNFMDGVERYISWPDNAKQPNDEWLYCICFPTGPYIFGNYMNNVYPKKTFDAFFAELKAFEPKYCDSANNCLYFTEDNSKAVHEAFWGIFNKHKGMVADEMKEQRKKELQKELDILSK